MSWSHFYCINLHVVLYQKVISDFSVLSFILGLCLCSRLRLPAGFAWRAHVHMVTSPALVSRCRLSCSAATATTWSQAAITAWCRCGRLVTSSNSTSTRAATPASAPWTCHMIRGENSQWGSRIAGRVGAGGLKLNATGGGDHNKLASAACSLLFHLAKVLDWGFHHRRCANGLAGTSRFEKYIFE